MHPKARFYLLRPRYTQATIVAELVTSGHSFQQADPLHSTVDDVNPALSIIIRNIPITPIVEGP